MRPTAGTKMNVSYSLYLASRYCTLSSWWSIKHASGTFSVQSHRWGCKKCSTKTWISQRCLWTIRWNSSSWWENLWLQHNLTHSLTNQVWGPPAVLHVAPHEKILNPKKISWMDSLEQYTPILSALESHPHSSARLIHLIALLTEV